MTPILSLTASKPWREAMATPHTLHGAVFVTPQVLVTPQT